MVVIFCVLLMAGITAGQVLDFSSARNLLSFVTSVCLAYIMIDVGLEFSVGRRKVGDFGWDAVVSVSAAVLPALLWFIYFIAVIQVSWQPALLSGLSSAPTSAGVLFAMMTAAGLSATWVFKKARTLAVLDDLATILMLAPLQILMTGFKWETLIVLVLIGFFVFASFRWQHALPLPRGGMWILFYALSLSALISVLNHKVHIHLEVLIPAFMWGCLMRPGKGHHVPPEADVWLDSAIKASFMFLVGLSFPKVTLGGISWGTTIVHVCALTFLANIGKCFPVLCYRKEAPFKERLALGVSMFPRGEVGAAVLLIAIGYGLGGYANTLAMLSLAFNLVLTGFFVWVVIKLVRKDG